MYIPGSMMERDAARVRAILREFPFASVITSGEPLHITHVPVIAAGSAGPLTELHGHMARANPHSRALDGRPMTAIFAGPHGYISPRWYASPRQVPTWNYVAVHVTGVARRVDAPDEAAQRISEQIATFEGPQGWQPEPGLIADLLDGIAAFVLDVAVVEAKLKLGQNREMIDRRAARAHLEQSEVLDHRELARWMRDTEPEEG
jgi:transcriptional regulator